MIRKILNIAIGLFLYGSLAGVFSWALHYELRLVGLIGILFTYIILFVQREQKRIADYIQVILIIIWATLYLLLLLVDIPLSPYNLIAQLSIFVWLLMEFILPKEKGESLFSGLNRFDITSLVLMAMGFLGIMVGSLLKKLSFSGANLLLMIGFAFLGIFLLKSILFPSNKIINER